MPLATDQGAAILLDICIIAGGLFSMVTLFLVVFFVIPYPPRKKD